MTLQEWCEEKEACGLALEWLADRDLPTAWRECPQGDWMLWLAARLCCYGDDLHRAVVLAAVECAETARQFAPPEHLPLIDRCYETARAWALGPTPENVAAALAADAAYAALATADAAEAAADAATYATYAATAATYAATAATYATYEAAADPKAAHLRCAEIVRKHVPLDLVLEALEREAA